MIIKTCKLHNFRNYTSQKVEFSKGVNFFVGENGSGKTNLLESIYFMSLAKSYKTNEVNLIKYHKPFSRTEASIETSLGEKKLKVILTEKGKKTLINDVEIKRLSDYIGVFKVISFLPEDLMIIKGSPKDRRYFIDLMYGQIDKQYLKELGNYKQLLKQRNEHLKRLSEMKKPEYTLLDVITEQLADSADLIVNFRRLFIEKINRTLSTMYDYLADKEHSFSFEYKPSLSESFEKQLKSRYKNDVYLKTTSYGPHRDEYLFSVDEYNAKDVASQGEQRTMVLAIIMAISKIIYETSKEQPVFLLDDVFSELDHLRQNRLISYLLKQNSQAIITTTNTDSIDQNIITKSKVFTVHNNAIKEAEING